MYSSAYGIAICDNMHTTTSIIEFVHKKTKSINYAFLKVVSLVLSKLWGSVRI